MTKDHDRLENAEGIQRGSREPQGKRQVDAPLVSVVVPCYNQAHFLGEAIESVLDQSYPNFEVVVVDDGSTDDTSEVAASYPGVRLVRQENQGLSGARNAGLARSEGEYVVFLDADDRLLPEALETGVDYLEARPECAFVHGHYRSITIDGLSLLEQPQAVGREDEPYAKLLYRNYISMHATVMYRRTVFETVGDFDTSLGACEDYDHYLRVARKFAVCRHEKVVAEYRQHDSNMTGNAARMLSASVTVLRSQRKHIRGHKQYEESYKAGIRFWQYYYGDPLVSKVRTHARGREWGRVLRGMLVLLRYHPWGILLSERRMERRKLVQWLQSRRDELEVRERRLKELESAQDAQNALAEEHQEVQELKRRIRWFERRIQDLSLQARLRARFGQKSGKSRPRLLDRLGRLRIALLSERRMERRRLAQRLQARRDELEACEGRLKELEEGVQGEESESALLAKQRQEAQQHRRRIRRLERRMQNLSLQARLRARIGQRSGKVRRLSKRLGSLRAKVSGRWRMR